MKYIVCEKPGKFLLKEKEAPVRKENEALLKINDSLYSDLNALIPNEFPSNSLLFLTPEGKKNIAASFMYKSTSIDTFPKKIIGRFIYDDVSVIVKEVDNKKIFHATIQNINVLSCSKLVLENSIRNIKSNKRGIQDTQLYKLAGLSDVNTTLSFYLQNEIIGIKKLSVHMSELLISKKAHLSFTFSDLGSLSKTPTRASIGT